MSALITYTRFFASSSDLIFVAAFQDKAAKLKVVLPQLGNLLAVDNITLIFAL